MKNYCGTRAKRNLAFSMEKNRHGKSCKIPDGRKALYGAAFTGEKENCFVGLNRGKANNNDDCQINYQERTI